MRHYELSKPDQPDIGIICIHQPSWWQPWRKRTVHYTSAGGRTWELPFDRMQQFIQLTPFGGSAMSSFAEMYGKRVVIE